MQTNSALGASLGSKSFWAIISLLFGLTALPINNATAAENICAESFKAICESLNYQEAIGKPIIEMAPIKIKFGNYKTSNSARSKNANNKFSHVNDEAFPFQYKKVVNPDGTFYFTQELGTPWIIRYLGKDFHEIEILLPKFSEDATENLAIQQKIAEQIKAVIAKMPEDIIRATAKIHFNKAMFDPNISTYLSSGSGSRTNMSNRPYLIDRRLSNFRSNTITVGHSPTLYEIIPIEIFESIKKQDNEYLLDSSRLRQAIIHQYVYFSRRGFKNGESLQELDLILGSGHQIPDKRDLRLDAVKTINDQLERGKLTNNILQYLKEYPVTFNTKGKPRYSSSKIEILKIEHASSSQEQVFQTICTTPDGFQKRIKVTISNETGFKEDDYEEIMLFHIERILSDLNQEALEKIDTISMRTGMSNSEFDYNFMVQYEKNQNLIITFNQTDLFRIDKKTYSIKDLHPKIEEAINVNYSKKTTKQTLSSDLDKLNSLFPHNLDQNKTYSLTQGRGDTSDPLNFTNIIVKEGSFINKWTDQSTGKTIDLISNDEQIVKTALKPVFFSVRDPYSKINLSIKIRLPQGINPLQKKIILTTIKDFFANLPIQIPLIRQITILPTPFRMKENGTYISKTFDYDLQRAKKMLSTYPSDNDSESIYRHLEIFTIGEAYRKDMSLISDDKITAFKNDFEKHFIQGMANMTYRSIFSGKHKKIDGYQKFCHDLTENIPDAIKNSKDLEKEQLIEIIKSYLIDRRLANYSTTNHGDYQKAYNLLENYFYQREAVIQEIQKLGSGITARSNDNLDRLPIMLTDELNGNYKLKLVNDQNKTVTLTIQGSTKNDEMVNQFHRSLIAYLYRNNIDEDDFFSKVSVINLV
ncbi:MAG: hypothetical protein J6Y94_02235, partial [Bacteriovoracaceae bacterium]|nr:hypothetical protein [Bacteriovoracaceae bacterium]